MLETCNRAQPGSWNCRTSPPISTGVCVSSMLARLRNPQLRRSRQDRGAGYNARASSWFCETILICCAGVRRPSLRVLCSLKRPFTGPARFEVNVRGGFCERQVETQTWDALGHPAHNSPAPQCLWSTLQASPRDHARKTPNCPSLGIVISVPGDKLDHTGRPSIPKIWREWPVAEDRWRRGNGFLSSTAVPFL